jgi:hypothetical protein
MITMPIRVKEFPEAFYVTDALDRRLAYVYFEDDPDPRFRSKRVSKAEAQEIAVTIAAALNAKFERSAPPCP